MFIDLNSGEYRIVEGHHGYREFIPCSKLGEQQDLFSYALNISNRDPRLLDLMFDSYERFKIFKPEKFVDTISTIYSAQLRSWDRINQKNILRFCDIFVKSFSANNLAEAMTLYVRTHQLPYNQNNLNELCILTRSYNLIDNPDLMSEFYDELTDRHSVLLLNIVRETLSTMQAVDNHYKKSYEFYEKFMRRVEDTKNFSPIIEWALSILTNTLFGISVKENIDIKFPKNIVAFVDKGISFMATNGFSEDWETKYNLEIMEQKRLEEVRRKQREAEEREYRESREREEREYRESRERERLRERKIVREKLRQEQREAEKERKKIFRDHFATNGSGGRIKHSFAAKNFNIEKVYGSIYCEPWNMSVPREEVWYLVPAKVKKDCKRKKKS